MMSDSRVMTDVEYAEGAKQTAVDDNYQEGWILLKIMSTAMVVLMTMTALLDQGCDKWQPCGVGKGKGPVQQGGHKYIC